MVRDTKASTLSAPRAGAFIRWVARGPVQVQRTVEDRSRRQVPTDGNAIATAAAIASHQSWNAAMIAPPEREWRKELPPHHCLGGRDRTQCSRGL